MESWLYNFTRFIVVYTIIYGQEDIKECSIHIVQTCLLTIVSRPPESIEVKASRWQWSSEVPVIPIVTQQPGVGLLWNSKLNKVDNNFATCTFNNSSKSHKSRKSVGEVVALVYTKPVDLRREILKRIKATQNVYLQLEP
jgi:hypothetical protein